MAFVAFVLALFSLALTIHHQSRRRVVANEFVLLDENKRVRGIFGLGKRGEPRLVLLDEENRERLEIAGPWFAREEGKSAGPSLYLRSPNGAPLATLAGDSAPRLTLRNEDGSIIARSMVFPNGQGTFELRKNGTGPSANLSMSSEGEPEVRMHSALSRMPDSEKRGIGLRAILSDGVFLFGDRGELRFAAMTRTGRPPLLRDVELQPGLYLFDATGARVFTQPL